MKVFSWQPGSWNFQAMGSQAEFLPLSQVRESLHFGRDAEIQAMDGKKKSVVQEFLPSQGQPCVLQPDGICNPVPNVSWLDRHGVYTQNVSDGVANPFAHRSLAGNARKRAYSGLGAENGENMNSLFTFE